MEAAIESLLDVKLGLAWYLTKKIAKLSYDNYTLFYKLPTALLIKIYNSGLCGIMADSMFNITKSACVLSYNSLFVLKDIGRHGCFLMESIRRARIEMVEKNETKVKKAKIRRTKSNLCA